MALLYISHADETERRARIERVRQGIAENAADAAMRITKITSDINKGKGHVFENQSLDKSTSHWKQTRVQDLWWNTRTPLTHSKEKLNLQTLVEQLSLHQLQCVRIFSWALHLEGESRESQMQKRTKENDLLHGKENLAPDRLAQ